MARAGHLRLVGAPERKRERAGRIFSPALFLAPALLSGCVYGRDRLNDFADIFRLEGQAGYGLQAHAQAGELAHVGLGSSRRWSAGLVYGRIGTQDVTEDHLPLTILWSILDPEKEHVHRLGLGTEGAHRCYLIFPGALNPGTLEKDEIRYLDLEAGFLAGVAGLEAGVSPGEFLDWFLGLLKFDASWTFLDIAGDDAPEWREGRRLWTPRRKREGYVPSN
jgi:hypothetical protein